MARKIVDIMPVITVRSMADPAITQDVAQAQADELLDRLKAAVKPSEATFNVTFETDYSCEHCKASWTEKSETFNGGCCNLDEANDPERIASIRKLIERIDGVDFYRIDEDDHRSRDRVHWPNNLAGKTNSWLDLGRPADLVGGLLEAAARVEATDWCTVWEDPGPTGCSLPRRPDHVTRDENPKTLADEVRSLIEDMGLTPARRAA